MASLLLSSNGKSEENLDLPDRTVEEKQNMEVSDLLKMFERASGEEMDNDRMLLG